MSPALMAHVNNDKKFWVHSVLYSIFELKVLSNFVGVFAQNNYERSIAVGQTRPFCGDSNSCCVRAISEFSTAILTPKLRR